MTTYSAVIDTVPVVSEYDEGPHWVRVLNEDGSIANSGRRFASSVEAHAFAEGLDMAARLSGHRVILKHEIERCCSEPRVLGGRCDNCETWINDEVAS